MDIKTLDECITLALAGKITFPETVKRLAATGTERYIVDLIGKQKLNFGVNGETYISSLAFDGPIIPQHFDTIEVQNAIKAIQQQQIDFRTFLYRIMEAGCCHYEAYILGKKVIYLGRYGELHIEPFPGAK